VWMATTTAPPRSPDRGGGSARSRRSSYNDDAPTTDLGGSFREFDPHTYQYPVAAPYPTQANAFHQLNQLVLATQPSGAVQQLINGLYSGGPATYSPSFVPPGWQCR
jgi:hypothetical protein